MTNAAAILGHTLELAPGRKVARGGARCARTRLRNLMGANDLITGTVFDRVEQVAGLVSDR